jgi:hypothetical protein
LTELTSHYDVINVNQNKISDTGLIYDTEKVGSTFDDVKPRSCNLELSRVNQALGLVSIHGDICQICKCDEKHKGFQNLGGIHVNLPFQNTM